MFIPLLPPDRACSRGRIRDTRFSIRGLLADLFIVAATSVRHRFPSLRMAALLSGYGVVKGATVCAGSVSGQQPPLDTFYHQVNRWPANRHFRVD